MVTILSQCVNSRDIAISMNLFMWYIRKTIFIQVTSQKFGLSTFSVPCWYWPYFHMLSFMFEFITDFPYHQILYHKIWYLKIAKQIVWNRCDIVQFNVTYIVTFPISLLSDNQFLLKLTQIRKIWLFSFYLCTYIVCKFGVTNAKETGFTKEKSSQVIISWNINIFIDYLKRIFYLTK